MQWRLITPGLVLVVGCGIPTAVSYIHNAEQQQAARADDARIAEQLQFARELPANPPDVAVALTKFIGIGGQDADTTACLMFSPTAANQLAASQNTTSCPAAIQALHDQVTDPATYINSVTVSPDLWSTTGDTGNVNGCAVTWNDLFIEEPLTPPGPQPGHLTLTRQDSMGWLITGYRRC